MQREIVEREREREREKGERSSKKRAIVARRTGPTKNKKQASIAREKEKIISRKVYMYELETFPAKKKRERTQRSDGGLQWRAGEFCTRCVSMVFDMRWGKRRRRKKNSPAGFGMGD
jgi:hypothetical protein